VFVVSNGEYGGGYGVPDGEYVVLEVGCHREYGFGKLQI
jgi:hypothetical protein